jgi:hypothetical protein
VSGHTPGPWEAKRGAGWYVYRPSAASRRDKALAVGMTPAASLVSSPRVSGEDWFEDSEAEANAYLMAAAPDLLGKLCEAVELLEIDPEADEVGSDAWNWLKQARELIAKAEGRK